MQADPMMMEGTQGLAYFTFNVRATPESPSECTSFRLDQASLLEDILTVAHMLTYIWGPIDDLISFVTLQYHLCDFCHEIIRRRNGLGVGFYITIFSHTAGTLQQQRSITTNIREEMVDEGLVHTASELGLDQTAMAKLERVDAAEVLNHDDCCSVCFEEFKEIVNGLDVGLARTPCSHMFHYDCITQWLKRSETCPLCRHEIN